jgi:hypothetical protein
VGIIKRKREREEAEARADFAVGRFWGVSSGAPGDLEDTEECVRECKLSGDALHRLRCRLPLGASGTTGSRVARIDRVLKSLEKGA